MNNYHRISLNRYSSFPHPKRKIIKTPEWWLLKRMTILLMTSCWIYNSYCLCDSVTFWQHHFVLFILFVKFLMVCVRVYVTCVSFLTNHECITCREAITSMMKTKNKEVFCIVYFEAFIDLHATVYERKSFFYAKWMHTFPIKWHPQPHHTNITPKYQSFFSI